MPLGNFQPTRLFISPKGAPSMIVGQWLVRNFEEAGEGRSL